MHQIHPHRLIVSRLECMNVIHRFSAGCANHEVCNLINPKAVTQQQDLNFIDEVIWPERFSLINRRRRTAKMIIITSNLRSVFKKGKMRWNDNTVVRRRKHRLRKNMFRLFNYVAASVAQFLRMWSRPKVKGRATSLDPVLFGANKTQTALKWTVKSIYCL